MDADSSNLAQLTNNLAADTFAVWSPDGSRIAFQSDRDGDFDIYLMDANGSNIIQLTDDPALDIVPAWSPDGDTIAFHSNRLDDNYDIYLTDVACPSGPAACDTQAVRLTEDPGDDVYPSVSPDGSQIVFHSDRDGDRDIYRIRVDGSNLVQLTNDLAEDREPAWSPDGRHIAFRSDRDGDYDIYMMDADGGNVRQLTNDPAEDGQPVWQP
jgi:Tol biopolymer transport system component